MFNIETAASLIEFVKSQFTVPFITSKSELYEGINAILERADRLDEIDFDGNNSRWFYDINDNAHRICVRSFGGWYVETTVAFRNMMTGQVVEYAQHTMMSAPLRTQGQAVSVLARKLMIHPNPSEG